MPSRIMELRPAEVPEWEAEDASAEYWGAFGVTGAF